MGFKEDADFARYLTIGAHAAAAVAADLNSHGHQIIELERYAMANKVWTVKVKRLRLPDLLCVSCGRRFESKGKSKFELKLSHSETPGREWHAGGMRPDDIFAFVRVVLEGTTPIAYRPVYVTRRALSDAFGAAKAGQRKAVSAGAEADVTWPAWVPSYAGQVLGFAKDGAIVVYTDGGRQRRYANNRLWPATHLYLEAGSSFEASSTAVAGAVEPADVVCPGETWDIVQHLDSNDNDSRYAAIKAARFRPDGGLDRIEAVALDSAEDWRVRLEAIATCAATDPERYVSKLRRIAVDPETVTEQQMEAVFILTELSSSAAAEVLYHVASTGPNVHQEVRAAAAWGLGEAADAGTRDLLRLLDDEDDRVALHAASALPEELGPDGMHQLISWLRGGTRRQSAVAAELLSRREHVNELHDLAMNGDGDGRLFATRALGELPRATLEAALGSPLAKELQHLLEPIWIARRNWLMNADNAGALDVLAAQRIKR